MADPTTTDEADRQGYNHAGIVQSPNYEIGIDVLVKKGVNLNGKYQAWDCNHQRLIEVDGSNSAFLDNS